MNLRSKSPHFRPAKYTGFAVISSGPKWAWSNVWCSVTGTRQNSLNSCYSVFYAVKLAAD